MPFYIHTFTSYFDFIGFFLLLSYLDTIFLLPPIAKPPNIKTGT